MYWQDYKLIPQTWGIAEIMLTCDFNKNRNLINFVNGKT